MPQNLYIELVGAKLTEVVSESPESFRWEGLVEYVAKTLRCNPLPSDEVFITHLFKYCFRIIASQSSSVGRVQVETENVPMMFSGLMAPSVVKEEDIKEFREYVREIHDKCAVAMMEGALSGEGYMFIHFLTNMNRIVDLIEAYTENNKEAFIRLSADLVLGSAVPVRAFRTLVDGWGF